MKPMRVTIDTTYPYPTFAGAFAVYANWTGGAWSPACHWKASNQRGERYDVVGAGTARHEGSTRRAFLLLRAEGEAPPPEVGDVLRVAEA